MRAKMGKLSLDGVVRLLVVFPAQIVALRGRATLVDFGIRVTNDLLLPIPTHDRVFADIQRGRA